MAQFTYPSSDLDKRENLLALLGSHWQNTYQGNSLVSSYTYARAQEEVQAHLDLLETVAALSHQEVPVFHREEWHLLTLLESARNDQPLKYGEGGTYGSGYKYGERLGLPVSRFAVDAEIKNAPAIFNRITAPSVSLVQGIDYTLADGVLTFTSNPFDNPLIPKRDVYTEGVVTDREIALWVFRSEHDWDHIRTHFGFILDLDLVSSQAYSDMVTAILSAFAQGSLANHINLSLSALTGIPVAQGSETVELITTDNNHLIIATEQNAYRFPKTDTATVAVGDSLTYGDFLTNAVRVDEFNNGLIPSGLTAIIMDSGFLAEGYAAGITFKNETVATTVTENVSGKTKIEWPLSGFPTDVTGFWDDVHSRGVAAGDTLANRLDVRGLNPPTEPTAASLPGSINPLEFLIENHLRFNTFLIRVASREAVEGVGLENARLLRKVIPPWTAMILLYELDIDEETITLDGTDTVFGITEAVTTFSGGDTQTDSFDIPTNSSETVTARLVEGVCE